MNTTPQTYAPLQALKTLMAQTHVPERTLMTRIWSRVSLWRQRLLLNTFRQKQGHTVHSGPFAGMTYLDAAEGALLPRLIGCYEAELHPTIWQLSQAGYQHIIDIGCAEGYYAVGLARLLKDCQIHAHDINEAALMACAALAKVNGVDDRVIVGGEFDPHTLQQYLGHKTLVFCDIEGAESELLDPEKFPGFRQVDLIVEVHECYKKGLSDTLIERFNSSHDIEWIWPSTSAARDLPKWVSELTHLDQLLCTWEWREGPTPWAVMRRRQLATDSPK